MGRNQFGRRLLALALSGCLLLGLTACGGGDTETDAQTTDQQTTTTTSSPISSTTSGDDAAEYGYLSTVTDLDVDLTWADGFEARGDKLYLTGQRYDQNTSETAYCVYVMDLDGTVEQVVELPDATPGWYQSMTVGDDCIWAVTYTWVEGSDDSSLPTGEEPADDWTVSDPAGSTGTDTGLDDWTNSDVGDAADWGREVETTEELPGEEEALPAETEADTEDDTDWLYEDSVMDDEYGYGAGYEVYTLLQFDMNGQQLSSQVLTGPEDADYFYVGDMQTDLAGNVYLQGDNFVMVLDSQGQQLATVTVPNWISQVVTLPDGQVMLYYYNEDYEQALGYLDPATWEIGSSILMEVPNDSYVYTYYAGSDGQLYASNTMGLYHCNLQNGTMEQMLEWLDCNINAYSVYGRAIVSEELVLSVGTDDVTRNYQLTTLTRVPADQIPQKIELTMGVTWLSYNARELILNFNRTNSEYSITIKDYSVYNTDDDYTAAQTQMERDMISGNCPDILFLDSTDTIERYVSKGILVDLYTLMGPDTVEADDLVDTYRRIMEVDGGLYCIYPTFCIDTMLGASSVVGTESGWTLAEFSALAQEYAARDAVLWSYMTREEALTTLLSYNYDTFVDRESGQCSFDGAEFQALLETCALFPEDYSYYNDRYDQDLQYSSSLDQMRVGDLLVQFSSIYALEDMRYDLDTLADDLTFIGIPGVEGNGAVLSTSSGYAISAQSPYQDVAWQFLSTMLTEDYAENKVYNLSVLKSYLAKQAEAAQEKPYYIDDDGNKVEYSDTALTQAQVDRLLDIIDNVEGRYTYDDDLMEIVLDESAAYFAGQKTAADVANLIQSRVQIYLDEQQ